MELPKAAGAVIIGGGVIGSSAAYHLAKMGCRDVVILERRRLTCGTTWHSAGQVRQLRSTRNLTELIRYSARLYASLEAETGQATGWLETGSLSIATNPDRLIHIKRQASLARAFGVEADVIDAGRAGELWPLMRTDDIIGAVYSPTDGRVNPSDLCLALVKGAKALGVQVIEGVPVTGFSMRNGRMAGVETGAGTIETPVAVDCAGLWGRAVAALAGAAAPLHAVEHFYLLTEPMPGVDGHLPILSDHDGHLYLRDEVGGLLVGCFEPGGKPLAIDDLPAEFEFDLLNEDWDHFEPMMINAIHRIPALETARARMLLVGPESFTADGMFLLGEAPETPGFFLCCGMNSGGVTLAGGVGKALAEWVLNGRPERELWHADIRRFPAVMNGLKGLRERAPETMMLHFAVAYPDREHDTARDLRQSPLHGRLAKRGARFEQRMAWERPAWFSRKGSGGNEGLYFGKPPWFDRLRAEHRAAREGVAVFDQTSFGKLKIQGRDAEALLGRLAANDVAVPPGRVVYTGFLNEDGGYESDLTLMRLDGDTFMAVTGSARPVRDADWIRGHMEDGEAAAVTDVSEEYAVLGVAGPRSRELLSRLGDADFSNFPYYACREIEAAGATVLAARLSYSGELGWELYTPVTEAGALYDALMEAGEDLGLVDAGMKALASLRLEKAYRDWGHDLSPDDTPWEAGLGSSVKLDKPVPFIGRDALLRQRDLGLSRRLVVFTMDGEDAYPLGGEPIYHQDRLVGETKSAAFGHTLGRAVALGYVDTEGADIGDMIGAGGFELEIACERFRAAASLKSPYDPEGRRPRM